MRLSLSVMASLGLCACMSAPLPEGSFEARGTLGPTAERMAEQIRECWFLSQDEAFAELRQETEISSLSDQPRILLVRSDERGGLPQLVVTVRRIDGRTIVSAFGPLTNTAVKSRINSDIGRWARGARSCGRSS